MVHNVELLANAVVAQAAHDYRVALIEQHDNVYDPEGDDYKKWTKKVDELERFFTGGDINAWTKLDGVALMGRLKKEVINYNYDLKAITKSHQLKGGDP